jgi:hypothetical protein
MVAPNRFQRAGKGFRVVLWRLSRETITRHNRNEMLANLCIIGFCVRMHTIRIRGAPGMAATKFKVLVSNEVIQAVPKSVLIIFAIA